DGRAGMMGDDDLGLPDAAHDHVLALGVGEEATGVDPFRVLDATAVSPVAADHVTTLDRAGVAARHTVAGDGDVRTTGEHLLDALILDVDGHGGAFHVG